MRRSYIGTLQIPHWDRIHYTETVFMVCKVQDPPAAPSVAPFG